MADTEDLKSSGLTAVRVRIPPRLWDTTATMHRQIHDKNSTKSSKYNHLRISPLATFRTDTRTA